MVESMVMGVILIKVGLNTMVVLGMVKWMGKENLSGTTE